jgi:hypothetical protein
VSAADDLAEIAERMAPIVLAVRGQDLATKRRVTAALAPASQSVFAWYSFHAHAGTGDGTVDDVWMFQRLCELYVQDWDVWDDVERAADHLGVVELVTTCRRIREHIQGAPGGGEAEGWRRLSLDFHATTPAVARAAVLLLGAPDPSQDRGR